MNKHDTTTKENSIKTVALLIIAALILLTAATIFAVNEANKKQQTLAPTKPNTTSTTNITAQK